MPHHEQILRRSHCWYMFEAKCNFRWIWTMVRNSLMSLLLELLIILATPWCKENVIITTKQRHNVVLACYVVIMLLSASEVLTSPLNYYLYWQWRHMGVAALSAHYWIFIRVICRCGSPTQRASNVAIISVPWRHHVRFRYRHINNELFFSIHALIIRILG